jgi:hypothetical protein
VTSLPMPSPGITVIILCIVRYLCGRNDPGRPLAPFESREPSYVRKQSISTKNSLIRPYTCAMGMVSAEVTRWAAAVSRS